MSSLGAVELVIFDMAGTTVQDDGQVPEAFTAALAEYGVTVGPAVIRALRGASKQEAIRGLLPAGAAQAELTERAYASFRHHLAGGLPTRPRPSRARATSSPGSAIAASAWP